jgi:hypothetical protein
MAASDYVPISFKKPLASRGASTDEYRPNDPNSDIHPASPLSGRRSRRLARALISPARDYGRMRYHNAGLVPKHIVSLASRLPEASALTAK